MYVYIYPNNRVINKLRVFNCFVGLFLNLSTYPSPTDAPPPTLQREAVLVEFEQKQIQQLIERANLEKESEVC